MAKDNTDILICPACGRVMEKIFINEIKKNIDICTDGCGGIYFDNRELELCDEKHENISQILSALEGKDFITTDETKQRGCPNCGSIMIKNKTSFNGCIEIDECYTCGGKFLDYKELEEIRAEFGTENDRRNSFNEAFYNEYRNAFATVDQPTRRNIMGSIIFGLATRKYNKKYQNFFD